MIFLLYRVDSKCKPRKEMIFLLYGVEKLIPLLSSEHTYLSSCPWAFPMRFSFFLEAQDLGLLEMPNGNLINQEKINKPIYHKIINEAINQAINQKINQRINQSINQF